MAGTVGLGNGQAVDVVAPPRKQPDHPRQHAAFVIDDNRQRMRLDHHRMGIAQIIGRMAAGTLLDVQRRHALSLSF